MQGAVIIGEFLCNEEKLSAFHTKGLFFCIIIINTTVLIKLKGGDFFMKLRKFIAAALSLMLACSAMPFNNAGMKESAVFAEEEAEYTEGTYGVLTYRNYGEYIIIFGCDMSATEVEIPSEIEGVPVTGISSAFDNCDQLTNVKIPEGVTWINTAFHACSSLTSITLPDSLTSIGEWSFDWCVSLENIIIPDNVAFIGFEAFLQCQSLKSITIPENVTTVYSDAFSHTGLTQITFLNPECKIYDSKSTICNGSTEDGIYFGGTIYGYENSTAQAYAEKYDYNFEIISETIPGDTDGDGAVNSSDASKVLAAYAITATGGDSPLSDIQKTAADVNKDSAVDSSDASSILAYYAYTATGGEGTLEEFLN